MSLLEVRNKIEFTGTYLYSGRMENLVGSINDLPNEVIGSILRMAISTVSRAYFCVSKRIAAVYSCVAKYRICNYPASEEPAQKCLICYDREKHNYPHLIACIGRPIHGTHCGKHRRYLLIDNVCEGCLVDGFSRICPSCKIPFMDIVSYHRNSPTCARCRFTLLLSNHGDISDDAYKLCRKGIVSPEGFPYSVKVYTNDEVNNYKTRLAGGDY